MSTNFSLVVVADGLEELRQMRFLVFEEFDLVLTLLRLDLSLFLVALIDSLNLRLQLDYFVRLLSLLGFELSNFLL